MSELSKKQPRDLSDKEFKMAKELYTMSFDFDYELTAPYPRAFYTADDETLALVSPKRDEKYKFQKSFQWKNMEFYVFSLKSQND